jgi:hypothetical protein
VFESQQDIGKAVKELKFDPHTLNLVSTLGKWEEVLMLACWKVTLCMDTEKIKVCSHGDCLYGSSEHALLNSLIMEEPGNCAAVFTCSRAW